MTEYRLSQEKNGIKVEMVVIVDGTVKVAFLITNNYGNCFVDIKYYDTLGNTKTVKVQTLKGDLNKSTGVVVEFPKPSTSFNACFDIVNITSCSDTPKPQIVRVTQSNILLWENGQQKVIPVFQIKDGINKLLGRKRDSYYWYPISAVKLYIPCFAGGYQWASVKLWTFVSDTCVDCYTDVVVYPEGGYVDVTTRKYVNYYTDYYFDITRTPVSLTKKTSIPYFVAYLSEVKKEVEIPVNCNLITITVGSLPAYGGIKIYHNNELVHQRIQGSSSSVSYLLKLIRNFKAGDKLIFEPVNTSVVIYDISMYEYTFKDGFDSIVLKVSHDSYSHTATIKTACVPEELADNYVNWLKTKGYNTVKINPGGTGSL